MENAECNTDNSLSSPGSLYENSLVFTETERLPYDIHSYSSFSTNYLPENILVDCPSDQSSRWSAHTNNPPQFLVLKLKRPAIVNKIKFGKFEKSHVCNIKKFRIYGSLEEQHMALLLEAGLKNDNKPEIFKLRTLTENGAESLPVLYIKIVPLLSWGPTFNFSIWYIELHGQDDPMYTSTCLKNYNKLREVEIVRMCLKHFRQQGYDAAFKALQDQTQVKLENPLVSQFHQALVTQGNFEEAERLVVNCVHDGMMDEFLKSQDYKHKWRLHESEGVQPGTRGGHQLIMDTSKRVIYLYGGWNGYQDLSDLWIFHIELNSWFLLCENSEKINGPTPRSCHKMVFDPVSENIFMLGRYLDNSIRTIDYVKSDFYMYDTRARSWLQICDDTSQVGGPQLIYDHQMCIDAEKRVIYVFGGKVLTPRSVNSSTTSEPEYSGLFSYHIATNTWSQILVDCHHPSAAQADTLSIKSRITHCMVFHNKYRKLYIYGGQRGKEDIDEFISYEVDTQAISGLNKRLYDTGENKNEPSPGYTLRATIDCEKDEIYIFSSLSKLKDRRDLQQIDPSNSFWVYSLQTLKWSRIYTCHSDSVSGACQITIAEPCPRYAHQMIYDDVDKVHYLFGGNPGIQTLPQTRLDDFWVLSLEKPKREEISRYCRYLIRKLYYEEAARSDPMHAMQYLRTELSEVIDHSDAKQLKKFHKLASLLFKSEDTIAEERFSPFSTPPLGKISNTETDDKIAEVSGILALDDDLTHKLDAEHANQADELSLESCESAHTTTTATSEMSDTHSFSLYRRSGGKRARHDYMYDIKSRRAFLFNKIVRLMPAQMVQPERDLSDFVIM